MTWVVLAMAILVVLSASKGSLLAGYLAYLALVMGLVGSVVAILRKGRHL